MFKLFGRSKKKDHDEVVNKNSNLENGKNEDEYFENFLIPTGEETVSIGARSGLKYQNKYQKAGSVLAGSDVVDIASLKKKEVESVKKAVEPPKKDTLPLPEPDLLPEPPQTKADDDFDKFFEELMRESEKEKEEKPLDEEVDSSNLDETLDSLLEEVKAVEKPKAVQKPRVSTPKPKAPRAKKRKLIDIDIISGGVGGDII